MPPLTRRWSKPKPPARTSVSRFSRRKSLARGAAPRSSSTPIPRRPSSGSIDEEKVDAVVVGNVGMAGRKQFLLANIPNRVSHNARCIVIIVNTAHLSGPGTRPPPPTQPDKQTPLERRLLGRAIRILRVLVKTSVREFRNRVGADADAVMRARARRIRDALQELGPTFAKMGQVLSTRPDLLPQTIIEELATLQEKVTPLTEQEVVAAMERELGVPWEDVFASIESHADRGRHHRPGASRHARIGRPRRRQDSTADGGAGHRARSRIAGTAGRQAGRSSGIPARDRRAAPRSSVLRVVATRARLQTRGGQRQTHDRGAGAVHAPGGAEGL